MYLNIKLLLILKYHQICVWKRRIIVDIKIFKKYQIKYVTKVKKIEHTLKLTYTMKNCYPNELFYEPLSCPLQYFEYGVHFMKIYSISVISVNVLLECFVLTL